MDSSPYTRIEYALKTIYTLPLSSTECDCRGLWRSSFYGYLSQQLRRL